jgi:hypothetical protein
VKLRAISKELTIEKDLKMQEARIHELELDMAKELEKDEPY